MHQETPGDKRNKQKKRSLLRLERIIANSQPLSRTEILSFFRNQLDTQFKFFSIASIYYILITIK